MTVRGCAAATASLFGAALGCGTNTDPVVTVAKVSPEMAYNNAPTPLQIGGGPFRPAYHFDTMAGAASANAAGFSVTLTSVSTSETATPVSVQLAEVSWLTIDALGATLPADVPAGVYDVAVTDPRGRRTDLPEGFTSLGPDEDAPIVTIDAPRMGSIIGAETDVSVTIAADDGSGHLASLDATVTVMPAGIPLDVSCPPAAGPSKATCHFQFTAPTPASDSDTIVIDAVAVDSADKRTSLPLAYKLARRPVLTGLSPAIGPASGGTTIEVLGLDFVEPVDGEGTQLLIDGHPVPAQTISATRITAMTPSHDSVIATVTVSTGGAESLQMKYFQFVDRPLVKLVTPASGPLSGGTWLKIAGNNFRNLQTHITVGGKELLCRFFEGPNRILGKTPPASAPGPVAVTATDDDGGADTWVGVFTYNETDPPADPTNCDGRP
jgi:hypothetical protein